MKDLLFDQRRADSLRIKCGYCYAEPGNRCVNPKTGEPIEHQAAHWLRLVAARESVSS